MESKKLLLAVIFYLAFGILAITLYASTLGTTGTDFDTGTYGNTSYNTTGSFVFLGLTELPANQTNDTALKMNMTGNVLLLHLNNNSALGENNTTFFDSSGTGVNGTCMTNTGNCSIFEPAGKLSGAMNFSGHNEINFTSDAALPSGNNDRTIMMWIFPTSITEADRILSYGAWSAGNAFDIDFGQSSTNTTGYIWVIGHTNNYGSTDTAVQKNSWSHIAITLSGTNTLKFYINGSLKVTNTSVSLNTQGAGAWRLGNVLDTRGLPAPFFGTIDEVAIWNRTLSSEEIKEIYVRQIALN